LEVFGGCEGTTVGRPDLSPSYRGGAGIAD